MSADFLNSLVTFGQVILLDIVLSGDNAIIIGALAASLPAAQRQRAIVYGMILAVVLRIAMSLGVVYILKIPGIMVIGGLLLLYVAYKMFRDLTDNGHADGSSEGAPAKTFGAALFGIAMADVSMSLDNVLAVAGAAGDHIPALVVGLLLSVAFMTVAASFVAKIIDRFKWVAWIGLALVLFIAGRMIYHGVPDLVTQYHHYFG